MRPVFRHADPKDRRTAFDDVLQFRNRIKLQPNRNTKPVAQRRCEKTQTRGGCNQSEFRKINLHRTRRWPLADNQIQLIVFHCRIKDFFNSRIEPVDLVNEKNVALFQICEQSGEVPRFRNDRTGGRAEVHTKFARHDLGKGCFAEPGRPNEQDVVQSFPTRLGRTYEHLQVCTGLRLTDEVIKRLRAHSAVNLIAPDFRRDNALVIRHD